MKDAVIVLLISLAVGFLGAAAFIWLSLRRLKVAAGALADQVRTSHRLEPEREQSTLVQADTVHLYLEREDRPACRFTDQAPYNWPPGHYCVRAKLSLVNCAGCLQTLAHAEKLFPRLRKRFQS